MRVSKGLLFCAVLAALAPAAATAQPGAVTITYTLHRIPRIASNQLAVWIEDGEGRFVKTLVATDFMDRRRGLLRRPQACPEWVQAAGLHELAAEEIDAVSGATQKPGAISLTWDCRTAAGHPVPPGAYLYKVEGNLFWEKRVLWTGTIAVGGLPSGSAATAVYLPDASPAAGGPIVEGVTARFQP